MSAPKTLIVTGMSGAGRVTALAALEDLGFEAVDNMPLALIPRLAGPTDCERPVAIGVDTRTRGFSPSALLETLRTIGRRAAPDREAGLLFMECDDDALQRRYTTTRRRHPLAGDRPLLDGVRAERRMLAPLRREADWVIDTTDMAPQDLKLRLSRQFAEGPSAGPTVTVISFSFKLGLPREADLVFDARFLHNPHWESSLRSLTGLDPRVQAYIRRDPDFEDAIERLHALIAPLLPRYRSEGKSYLTIAIGCTGGKHRSVYVTEILAERLRGEGESVHAMHRDKPAEPHSAPSAGGDG